jgi:hypothetical protein
MTLHIYRSGGFGRIIFGISLVGRQHLQGVVVVVVYSCDERWGFFISLFYFSPIVYLLLGFFL